MRRWKNKTKNRPIIYGLFFVTIILWTTVLQQFNSNDETELNGSSLLPPQSFDEPSSSHRSSPPVVWSGRQLQQLNKEEFVWNSLLTDTTDRNDDSNHTKSEPTTIAQQYVERAFYESGWSDFVNLCPPNKTILPHRAHDDFVIKCVARAKTLGNTPGSHANRDWPWWIRTMLRDMTSKRSSMLGARFHMLQYNNPRLLQCVYEKGGTKQWRNIHCQHISDGAQTGKDFFQCFKKMPVYDYEPVIDSGKNNIPSIRVPYNPDDPTDPSPRSEKAVFLRDPLERFLSGFLDKCIRRRDIQSHCEPASVFLDNTTSPVTNLLWDRKFFFEMYVDAVGLKWDMHFFPQSLQCGGIYKNIQEYDFVGSMGTELYADLQRFVERFPALAVPVEKTFSLKRKALSNKTNTEGTETRAAGHVLEYYTPSSVRKVLSYYAIDYMLLPLKIPQWAEQMLQEDNNFS